MNSAGRLHPPTLLTTIQTDLLALLGDLGSEEPDWRQVFLSWAEARGIEGEQWLEILLCLSMLKIPSPGGAE